MIQRERDEANKNAAINEKKEDDEKLIHKSAKTDGAVDS